MFCSKDNEFNFRCDKFVEKNTSYKKERKKERERELSNPIN